MTDHPILFSGPMIRALLDGRKTQTRRVLKEDVSGYFCPPKIRRGDRLWVRETHGFEAIDTARGVKVKYRASNGLALPPESGWKPSIHMPRWASRLTLTVTDVRVQRLQDISEEDAKAEGVGSIESHIPGFESVTCVQSFQKLWDGLNADRGFGWDVNPWVAAYTFTTHPQNIDMEAG